MKRGSTVLLRVAVISLGLLVLGTCIFGVPAGLHSERWNIYHPVLWWLYVTAVPFFYALWQAICILGYIDANKAFSYQSVHSLQRVKYCAVSISILFTVVMPYVYYAADKNDSPGVIVLGMVVIALSFVIAATSGVLQRLVQHGVDLKEENDLTV